MKIIPTYLHGVLDYFVGVLLLIVPNLLGFADLTAAAAIARVIGGLIILQAVVTQYELGLFSLLPMRAHLICDYVVGVLLAVSPWLFQFSHELWGPHLLVGAFIFISALMTRKLPRERQLAERPAVP